MTGAASLNLATRESGWLLLKVNRQCIVPLADKIYTRHILPPRVVKGIVPSLCRLRFEGSKPFGIFVLGEIAK